MPAEDPKKRAQSIVDALPGSSLVSKTAILSAGAGVSVWAISNELYVLNEESVVAFCLLSVFYGIFRYGGPMYSEWAETTTKKIKDILDTAKKGHADSVRTRIEDVKPLNNVVEITKGLFEVSKVSYLPPAHRSWWITDVTNRKPPNLKPKHLNSSNAPPSPPKQEACSNLGSDTKAKSSRNNKEIWPRTSSTRSRRSSRTPKCCSKF